MIAERCENAVKTVFSLKKNLNNTYCVSIGKRCIDGITCFIKSQLSGSKLSEIHSDFLTSNSRIANKSENKGNVLIQLCSYEIGMLQKSGISGISNFIA